MNIVVLVPDGVGVRNFILGKLLRILPHDTQAHVFHGVPREFLPRVAQGINGQSRWHELVRFRPDTSTDLVQGSLAYAHMYWARTQAMRRTLSLPVRGSLPRLVIQRTKRTLGWFSANPRRMQLLERQVFSMVRKSAEARYYRQQFQDIRPEVFFCSQQLSLDAVPAVVAAKEMGIPTAAFIFSWDNLTSKGRIVAPFDYYLVWSDHMRQELLHYYPMIEEKQIYVVGTPQFEPYDDPEVLTSREEFLSELGADPERPVICYSGGDAGTCPEDPEHVRVLLEMIRDGRIQGKPQVIVRPVPVDDGKRYASVRQRFPELIFSPPQWLHAKNGHWSGFTPMPEDIRLLANLTQHVTMNVNLGSTMTLDFGIHDKPVVNVAFDVADPPVFGMPVYDFYYGYEHLQPVIRFQASRIARSAIEFATHVNRYLDDPSLDGEGRRKLVGLQVKGPLSESTERLVGALREIAI